MTKDEIIEYASRYVDADDVTDFPLAGDIFCFLQREIPDNRVLEDEEGWQFAGYAKLNAYELDMTAKPVGKWITIHYTSLAIFPPQLGEIRLQPPHIVLGIFSSPDRKYQTRLLRISNTEEFDPTFSNDENDDDSEPKLMQFPGRK